MPTAPAPEPAPVAKGVNDVESWLTKASAVAATVSGCITAAQHDLPLVVSSILTVVGPAVFVAERYWQRIRKAL